MIFLAGIFYVIIAATGSHLMGPYDYNKDHAQPRVQAVEPAASAPEVK